jgi:hypothetical protein
VTPEQMQKLREPFPESEIGKLPRVTCPQCRDSKSKSCPEHQKSKCDVCGNFITPRHIHLDYVGHAELTDRLLEVDPEWTWEPAAWSADGEPVIGKQGGNLVMWGRLTILGVTRLGVGTAPANKDDAHKELIGDFLRNAAMRFGVALDLWRKSERAEAEAEHSEPDKPAAKPSKKAAPKAAQAPAGDGLGADNWREIAARLNINPNAVLKAARALADEQGVPVPADLDSIPAALTGPLTAHLESKAAA